MLSLNLLYLKRIKETPTTTFINKLYYQLQVFAFIFVKKTPNIEMPHVNISGDTLSSSMNVISG